MKPRIGPHAGDIIVARFVLAALLCPWLLVRDWWRGWMRRRLR